MNSLQGHLLVASTSLLDPSFRRAVVLIVRHNEDGAVGLILGSLRMPALLKFTAESPQRLVGTNLSAGVLVGIAGAAGHLTSGSAAFDWQLFAVGAVCSPPGAWLGAQLTGRLPTQTLVRTIGAIVFLAALVMALQVAL